MTRPALIGLSVSLLASCSEAPLLDLKVVTPEGPDPLATADRLRLSVSQPAAEQVISVANPQSFSVELKLAVQSDVGTITLEAFNGQRLVARGETPPLVLRPAPRELSLLVGLAGVLSTLRPRLDGIARDPVSVLAPSLGVLLAGGRGSAGQALDVAWLYDFFTHAAARAPTLSTPRAGAVGAACGQTCALLALGGNDKELATEVLRFDGQTWSAIADNLAPGERRRDAAIAPLDDGRYLVVGGRDAAGAALDTVLHLEPGTLQLDPSFEVPQARAKAARVRPALAAASGAVLVVGGHEAGAPPAELYAVSSATFSTLTLPGPILAGGCAAVALADGRLAVVGGRDDTGALLRDAWIVDVTTRGVTAVPGALLEGRAGHHLVRLGEQLVVVGGSTESGAATQLEVLDGKTLARLAVAPAPTPRLGSVVAQLGPGSFVVAGGDGAAASVIELYETSQLAK